jgi:hypothetical protein
VDLQQDTSLLARLVRARLETRFQAAATGLRLDDGNCLWTLILKREFMEQWCTGVDDAGMGYRLGEMEICPGRHETRTHEHDHNDIQGELTVGSAPRAAQRLRYARRQAAHLRRVHDPFPSVQPSAKSPCVMVQRAAGLIPAGVKPAAR